jgi:hypothetical protein
MSPFPGIDPYVEGQKLWQDFHSRFLTALSGAISERLPEPYVARIDERLSLVEQPGAEVGSFRPDVAVVREGPGNAPQRPEPAAPTGVVPVTIPLRFLDEYRETSLEIWHSPDRRLVTVVELLSPTNQGGAGRREYLAKRNALIRQEINLVELDFLVSGRRLPMEQPLPPGDYYALVARGERMPDCDVYAWTVRDPIPAIPIPLLHPDPDIEVQLGPIFADVYRRARYQRSIDYKAPLALPLSPDGLDWAERLARAAGA